MSVHDNKLTHKQCGGELSHCSMVTCPGGSSEPVCVPGSTPAHDPEHWGWHRTRCSWHDHPPGQEKEQPTERRLNKNVYLSLWQRHVHADSISTRRRPLRWIEQKTVLAAKGKRSVGAITSLEKGKSMTVLHCVNADGAFIPPMIVYLRVRMKPAFLDQAPAGCLRVAAKSGWMNVDLFTRWLEHRFNNCTLYLRHTGLQSIFPQRSAITNTRLIRTLRLACKLIWSFHIEYS